MNDIESLTRLALLDPSPLNLARLGESYLHRIEKNEPSEKIILVADKWRGNITIATMKFFKTLDELKKYVQGPPPDPIMGWKYAYAWYIFSDRTPSKLLSKIEMQFVGLR